MSFSRNRHSTVVSGFGRSKRSPINSPGRANGNRWGGSTTRPPPCCAARIASAPTPRRRQVEHLAGSTPHRRRTDATMTGMAIVRRGMRFNSIRLRHALESMTGVTLLASRRFLAPGAQRFRRWFVQPVRGRRLAGVAAVFASRPCSSATVAASVATRANDASIRAACSVVIRASGQAAVPCSRLSASAPQWSLP